MIKPRGRRERSRLQECSPVTSSRRRPDTHRFSFDASDVCLTTTWIISWRTIRVTQVALHDVQGIPNMHG